MIRKQKVAVWNLQVPKPLDKALNKVILSNWHRTKAEFIRDAVREKMRKLGIEPKLEVS